MGKTPPKEEEADGNPRKKAPRVDDAALTTDAAASAPSLTGNTPPKGEGAEKGPRKTASRLDDADLSTATGASASSPTRKTPLKDEAEGSPPRKSPRRQDKRPAAAVPPPTVAESSELIVKGAGRAIDEKRCKCNHVITYGTIMNWAPLLESKDPWTCCGCQRENKEGIVKTRPPKSDHLICVTCYDHLCCGVGSIAYPFGHSREHALEKEHWFAVLYCDSERGYCFKCNAEVPMPVKFGDRDNEVGLQVIRSIVKRKLLDPPPSVGALITVSAPSPTGKTPLKGEAEGSPPKRSQSLRQQDKGPTAAVRLATVPESSELIVEGLGRASDENQCKCNHIITDKVIEESRAMKQMGLFQDTLTCFGCSDEDEEGIVETRPAKSDLLIGGKEVGLQEIRDNAQGYAIRGLSNLGNTCYMNAVLQCLFVLGKLRERILALDRPESPLAKALKKLFVEASSAGYELNLKEVLRCVHKHRGSNFEVGTMEDSHDFLMALRELWNQGDAPTLMDSIFGFEMAGTLSCKKCGHLCPPVPNPFRDLSMGFPSKGYPTKSAALPQTNESPREIGFQLVPAVVQRNLEKMQTVSASGNSDVIGSDVIVEKTHKPLGVDSSQAQPISESKDFVQSPLLIQEGKSVDSLREDSISTIEKLLSLFCEEKVKWRCPNCTKDHEPTASKSKNDEQIVGRGNADDVGDTAKIYGFTKLPPVLTLHLKRTDHLGSGNTDGIKINGHVKFMEYLDVKPFMDPSSVDKGSTRYRLVGVIEHIGKGSLKEKDGHYIAYVRARRLGNQQEGSSCSSSWFCANDGKITQVTLKDVLKIEAYILFYERMEDQGSDLSRWELIQSNEIVNCNVDLEDRCFVYKMDFENSTICSQVLHSQRLHRKYAIARNIVENNMEHVERLQQGAEWLGQYSPLLDLILPVPVCSIATKASSHLNKAIKAAEIMDQAFGLLRAVIPPSDHMAVLFVSNAAQARDAVDIWNNFGRSKWYFMVLEDGIDCNQARAVMEVLEELDAKSLFFDPDLSDSDI